MTEEETAFLNAIATAKNPAEERKDLLVYADWLEDQADKLSVAHAAFIRQELDLTQRYGGGGKMVLSRAERARTDKAATAAKKKLVSRHVSFRRLVSWPCNWNYYADTRLWARKGVAEDTPWGGYRGGVAGPDSGMTAWFHNGLVRIVGVNVARLRYSVEHLQKNHLRTVRQIGLFSAWSPGKASDLRGLFNHLYHYCPYLNFVDARRVWPTRLVADVETHPLVGVLTGEINGKLADKTVIDVAVVGVPIASSLPPMVDIRVEFLSGKTVEGRVQAKYINDRYYSCDYSISEALKMRR